MFPDSSSNGFGIMNKKELQSKLLACAFSLCLCGCLWFILTGGAFLIDWPSIQRWKQIFRFFYYGSIMVAALIVLGSYFRGRAFFNALWPVKWARAFYKMPPMVSVGIISLVFVSTQFFQQMAMRHAIETHLWDFGFFDQVLWNTARGDFLITSVRGGLHVFVEHFKPILVLVALFYRIFDSTPALLLAYDFFLAASLPAVYLIARQVLKSHSASLTLVLAVFFYQPLASGANFLFHTQTLIDPFLLFGFYFILKRRVFLPYLFFFLALTCKESALPDLLGIGLFLLVLGRKREGFTTLFMVALWLCLFLFVIEPHYVFPGHFKEKWTLYRGWLNPDPQLLKNILTPNPLEYLFKVFGPFLFLSFFCPKWYLLLLPSLLFRLTSLEVGMRSLNAHYMGGFEALIFISLVFGLSKILSHSPPRSLPALRLGPTVFSRKAILFLVLILTALLFSGRPHLVTIERFVKTASRADYQQSIRILKSVPPRFSVMTSQAISSFLTHRTRLFVFCVMFPDTPYQEIARSPDLVIEDARSDDPCAASEIAVLKSRGYRLLRSIAFIRVYSRLPETDELTNLMNSWDRVQNAELVNWHGLAKKIFLVVSAIVLLFLMLFYLVCVFFRRDCH